jgi:hypothetical protein
MCEEGRNKSSLARTLTSNFSGLAEARFIGALLSIVFIFPSRGAANLGEQSSTLRNESDL